MIDILVYMVVIIVFLGMICIFLQRYLDSENCFVCEQTKTAKITMFHNINCSLLKRFHICSKCAKKYGVSNEDEFKTLVNIISEIREDQNII